MTGDAEQIDDARWNAAVDVARASEGSAFANHMKTAEASFDVVPPNGAEAEGRTLRDFADAIGLAYRTLEEYRRVWRWLGEDSLLQQGIGYTVAVQAMTAGDTPAQVIERQAQEPPPGFKRWTVKAHEAAREMDGRAQEMRDRRVKDAETAVYAAQEANEAMVAALRMLHDGDITEDAHWGVLMNSASNSAINVGLAELVLSGRDIAIDWDAELAKLGESS